MNLVWRGQRQECLLARWNLLPLGLEQRGRRESLLALVAVAALAVHLLLLHGCTALWPPEQRLKTRTSSAYPAGCDRNSSPKSRRKSQPLKVVTGTLLGSSMSDFGFFFFLPDLMNQAGAGPSGNSRRLPLMSIAIAGGRRPMHAERQHSTASRLSCRDRKGERE